jgi:2-polyprenyl-3-methyl-5-hydroxy-6-metoxy-1,4-benzoquinol methylase
MKEERQVALTDAGERMIPPGEKEVSIVFARHRFAYEYVRPYVVDKNVLEIGCGTGYGCRLIAEAARRVVAIDRDSGVLAYCRRNYSAANIEYKYADASTLSLGENFDAAIAFQVIEHLAYPADFLARLKRAVRTGGTILITTPNSRTGSGSPSDNRFHLSEMNYGQFAQLLRDSFHSFELFGIGYAARNRLREFVLGSPLYVIGKLLKRKSALKKIAAQALNMTEYRILKDRVAEESIDLLAVCINP